MKPFSFWLGRVVTKIVTMLLVQVLSSVYPAVVFWPWDLQAEGVRDFAGRFYQVR